MSGKNAYVYKVHFVPRNTQDLNQSHSDKLCITL